MSIPSFPGSQPGGNGHTLLPSTFTLDTSVTSLLNDSLSLLVFQQCMASGKQQRQSLGWSCVEALSD